MTDDDEFARLLSAYRNGDKRAWEALIKLVYADLRRLAHSIGAGRPRDRTLDTTSLVNECYLRLAGPVGGSTEDRHHFFALASRLMRQAACDYARERLALKRGGDQQREDADAADGIGIQGAEELVELDDALSRLSSRYPRAAQVFECRYFGGLSEQQTADALGHSLRTVQRDWNEARSWLQACLS